MKINVGEQLVASYLRHILGCDFTQMNTYTRDTQGEIDVLGVDLKNGRAYICEVTVHLVTGLTYVGKDNKTNNVSKLTAKFSRDIAYARTYLKEYEHHFMFWSPIVKRRGQDDQHLHLKTVAESIKATHEVDLQLYVNEKFRKALQEMRTFAASQTAELQCPVLRLLQIEAYLDRHVQALERQAA
jgi:hypothetical protein